LLNKINWKIHEIKMQRIFYIRKSQNQDAVKIVFYSVLLAKPSELKTAQICIGYSVQCYLYKYVNDFSITAADVHLNVQL